MNHQLFLTGNVAVAPQWNQELTERSQVPAAGGEAAPTIDNFSPGRALGVPGRATTTPGLASHCPAPSCSAPADPHVTRTWHFSKLVLRTSSEGWRQEDLRDEVSKETASEAGVGAYAEDSSSMACGGWAMFSQFHVSAVYRGIMSQVLHH